jgi:hypothetical protein
LRGSRIYPAAGNNTVTGEVFLQIPSPLDLIVFSKGVAEAKPGDGSQNVKVVLDSQKERREDH